MAEKPTLNRLYMDEIRDKTIQQALRKAQEETQTRASVSTLTWQEVFDDDYTLLSN